MYFLLSLITTAILGWFMPQWMYNATWMDFVEFTSAEPTLNADYLEFLKKLELSVLDDNLQQLITEKLMIVIAIVVGIFIAMLIITSIIKRAVSKN